MFSENEGDGIAVVLEEHFDGTIPTTQSEGDPEQGWGESQSTNPYVVPKHIIH